ncbi:MAG: amino acid permease [Holosporaceae bacterium]|jgi:APA family basic amino acid/polyamine antiporter|nr:amino acid permease [Holosporaceae bacterium]
MSKKMGFGAVLALVFGSQIGSGIFVLPAALAPFGMFGVCGCLLAGLGATLLAFIFAELCSKFPRTGGPYVYVQQAFGRSAAFFIGWTYWLVSWTSTSVVIIAAVSNLSAFIGGNEESYLLWEMLLLGVVTAINCRSVELAGRIESFLMLFKFVPFLLVPAVLLGSFREENIAIAPKYVDYSAIKMMAIVTAMSFWGFIGVECATAPAGAVQNPSKNIPRAIIIGTVGVAAIYFINNLAIMGVISSNDLAASQSPYIDAIKMVLGKNLSKVVSLITFMILVGTSNAWTLASAQASLGLAQDGLLPAIFARRNRNLAPYVGVLISSVGMVPMLICSQSKNLSEQISSIVDYSTKVFFLVYMVCCMAFTKISMADKKLFKSFLGVIVGTFCLAMILHSTIISLLVSATFVCSGILMWPFVRRQALT